MSGLADMIWEISSLSAFVRTGTESLQCSINAYIAILAMPQEFLQIGVKLV